MIAFLIDNWLWIALIAVFVAMHRGGHGCGSHGNHSANDQTQSADHAGPQIVATNHESRQSHRREPFTGRRGTIP